MYDRWAPYVPVAVRRQQAAAEMTKLAKKGQKISPVVITGRTIASTAWGKAWCDNMESYSDYENRLPRGRTYVRNGSVVDLHITPGQVAARVRGSSMYSTTITVKPVAPTKWQQVCADCAGGIDSLVELLQGRLSKAVMERLCRQGDGLFPIPNEIRFDCSCPDGAYMCKHVAAVLYGVGARLDSRPELLFTLRQVNAAELLSQAGTGVVTAAEHGERTLASDDVAALFGLEMDEAGPAAPAPPPSKPVAAKPPVKPAAKKALKPAAKKVQAAPPTAQSKRAVISVAKPAVAGRSKAKPARPPSPSARLLAALRKAGSLDNTEARAATGLDAAAVRLLVKQLVADGEARVRGQGRGTRYVALKI